MKRNRAPGYFRTRGARVIDLEPNYWFTIVILTHKHKQAHTRGELQAAISIDVVVWYSTDLGELLAHQLGLGAELVDAACGMAVRALDLLLPCLTNELLDRERLGLRGFARTRGLLFGWHHGRMGRVVVMGG